jgi:hypothetical protein
MYMRSYAGGYGRNFFSDLTDGEVIIRSNLQRKGVKARYKVRNGEIVESVTRGGARKVHMVFGQFQKVYNHGKLVEEEYYRHDKRILHKGLYYRKVSRNHILERYSSGGSMAREIVYWKNGQLMYNLGKGNKNVRIYKKDGSPMAKITLSKGISMYSWKWNLHVDVPELKKLALTFRENWHYEIYGRNGNVYSWLKGENNTPTDGCKGRSRMYFMRGIHVPKKVITGDYDAQYILGYPNVTIRSELVKKYGIERMVKELEGETVDKNEEYELLQFPVPGGREPDNVLKVLKMRCPSTQTWYALRVPPQSADITEALNWTYGLNFTEIRKDKTVEMLYAT